MDNQQRSLEEQGVKLIKLLEKVNNKQYGLYLCPSCQTTHTYRTDAIKSHYRLFSYPKLCSKCANMVAGSKRKVHGDIETRLYSIWKNMRQRISNPNLPKAHIYYGLPLEPKWETFTGFKAWAEVNGYADNLTIDRIDPSIGYLADNCRWITLSENSARACNRAANKSNTKVTAEQVIEILALVDQGLTHQNIANMFGIARTTVGYIIHKERSTTISKESTLEANASGNGVQP